MLQINPVNTSLRYCTSNRFMDDRMSTLGGVCLALKLRAYSSVDHRQVQDEKGHFN